MPRYRKNLMICTGTGCVANGAFRIKESLEAAGCSIPFPQQDMHVINVPDVLTDKLSAS